MSKTLSFFVATFICASQCLVTFGQEIIHTGDPVSNLSESELRRYAAGFDLFVKVWSPEDGLGPFFNARSCAACHQVPMPGGSGTTDDTFVLQSQDVVDAASGSSVARFEWSAHQIVERHDLPETVSRRKSPPLFGLGLLEAIPASQILANADPDDVNRDGISGRVVALESGIGRFGWKANRASVREFVAAAFLTEMGLTSNQVVDDKSKEDLTRRDVEEVASYLRFLGAPPPGKSGAHSEIGEQAFMSVGCAKCHVPRFETISSVAALNGVTIRPYTDLLVHDMGEPLSELAFDTKVGRREFRTPPLWGLGSTGPPYLHDGRALSLADAILAHGGEAHASVVAFKQLQDEEQIELLRFVRSL